MPSDVEEACAQIEIWLMGNDPGWPYGWPDNLRTVIAAARSAEAWRESWRLASAEAAAERQARELAERERAQLAGFKFATEREPLWQQLQQTERLADRWCDEAQKRSNERDEWRGRCEQAEVDLCMSRAAVEIEAKRLGELAARVSQLEAALAANAAAPAEVRTA